MSKKKRNYDSYTGENVQVLDAIDGIRKRHGMYAGSIESVAHHLFDEIMDNSVDEFLNGFADTIWVNFNKKDNLITITDNGRGMPIDIHKESGKPTMEVLVSSTHAGGKFDNETFKVSSGLNGVGATVVNALSTTFDLTSFRGSHEYNIGFKEGRKVKDFKKSKKRKELSKEESGTIVSFSPDKTILGKYAKLDEKLIKESLEIRSYINSGLKIIFNDKIVYHHPNGIRELVEDRTDERFTDIFYFKEEEPSLGNLYEIAFTYVSESDETIYSFANGIETSKGTHESGFRKGLTDSMKAFIKDNNLLPKRGMKMKDITGEDIRSGIVAVVNIRYADADYSAQTKDELTNPELFGKIGSITKNNLDKIFNLNLDSFKKVGNRIVQFTRGRMRAASYKDAVVKVDNKAMGLVDNGKFVDCNGEDVSRREILIIEGDSASGSIKQSRSREWQAVFPLKGKILNTTGMQLSRIVKNEELNNLLVALFGSNDLNQIDLKEDLRFGKIIFLSDADHDGKK